MRGPAVACEVAGVRRLTEDATEHFELGRPRRRSSPSRPASTSTIVRDEDGEEVRRSYSSASPPGAGASRSASGTCPAGASRPGSPTACASGTASRSCRPRAASARSSTPREAATTRSSRRAAASRRSLVVATVLEEEPRSRCTVLLRQPADLLDHVPRGARGPEEPPSERGCRSSTCSRASRSRCRCWRAAWTRDRIGRAARRAAPAGDRRRVVPLRAVRDGARRARRPARARRRRRAHPPRALPRRRRPGRARDCGAGHGPRPSRSSSTGAARPSASTAARSSRPRCATGPTRRTRARAASAGPAAAGSSRARSRMDRPWALEDDEIDAGVVLACQAHPRSERIVLDFDAR